MKKKLFNKILRAINREFTYLLEKFIFFMFLNFIGCHLAPCTSKVTEFKKYVFLFFLEKLKSVFMNQNYLNFDGLKNNTKFLYLEVKAA